MTGAIVERVFLGRDNPVQVQFLQGADPFDSSPITRTVVSQGADNVLADSDQSPGLLSWSGDILTLKLGNAGIAAGRYRVRVIVYTATYPDGLVILSEASDSVLEMVVIQ